MFFFLLFAAVNLMQTIPTPKTKIRKKSKYIVAIVANRNHEKDFLRTIEAIRGNLSDMPAKIKVIWEGKKEEKVIDQVTEDSTKLTGSNKLLTKRKIAKARQIAADIGAAVVVFCEFDTSGAIFIYFSSWRSDSGKLHSEKVVMRPLDKSENAGKYEVMGLIVQVSINALIYRLPSPKLIKRTKKPKFKPLKFPNKKKSYRRISFGTSFFSTSYSKNHLIVPGVDMRMGLRILKNLYISISYSWISSIKNIGDRADIIIHRHPLSGGIEYRIKKRRLDLFFSGFLLLDFISFDTKVKSIFMEPMQTKGNVSFAIYPEIKLSYNFSKYFSGFASVGFEFMLYNKYYILEGVNNLGIYGSEQLSNPFILQPRIMLGFQVNFNSQPYI